VWVGESSFWYRPTRVVPDQRPLNGRCCCCCWNNHYLLNILLLLWHAPLGVHSAICRHQPAQRTVLGQVDFFVQCEVVGSQIMLDGVQPHDTRMPQWSFPVIRWGAVGNTHTRLTALFPGLPGWASTRKVKPIWILLKQETVSGSGISWAICKSASRSRQITTPVLHHSSFLQAGCPSCHRTNSVKALKANRWKHRGN